MDTILYLKKLLPLAFSTQFFRKLFLNQLSFSLSTTPLLLTILCRYCTTREGSIIVKLEWKNMKRSGESFIFYLLFPYLSLSLTPLLLDFFIPLILTLVYDWNFLQFYFSLFSSVHLFFFILLFIVHVTRHSLTVIPFYDNCIPVLPTSSLFVPSMLPYLLLSLFGSGFLLYPFHKPILTKIDRIESEPGLISQSINEPS